MKRRRKWIAVPLIVALCMLGPSSTITYGVDFNLQGLYTLSGGAQKTGAGSLQFDTATNTFTGTLNFSPGPPDETQWFWIPIVACLLICFAPDLDGEEAFLDRAGGDLTGTMASNFGAAGSATFTSHVVGTQATLTGDLTALNVGLLPPLSSSFDVIGNALIAGAGPGAAIGTSTASLLGITVTNSFSYAFLGNAMATVPTPWLIHSSALVSQSQSNPNNFVFSGAVAVEPLPEPSSLALLSTGLFGLLAAWRNVRAKRGDRV